MSRARVLIIDDSVVVRRMVARVLEGDPEIEVVGALPGVPQALPRIHELQPDFVILDVEMPDVTGLQAIPLIRQIAPEARIVMFSALTARGASITLDALSLGASDYVTKPAGVTKPAEAEERIRTELLAKLKGLWRRDVVPLRRGAGTTLPVMRGATGPARVDVVAIGASTGGPNALVDVLTGLGPRFATPVLIVQHMPPVFTRLLAERLAQRTGMRAAEARDGEELLPGGVWLAPGDHHMVVARHGTRLVIRLHQEPPENYCRPAVDALFRSLAPIFGPRALAVVLTGMGQDGYRGCREIVSAGGQVLAQDQASSVVWGMPGQVITAGLADEVAPLSEIAACIIRRVKAGAERTSARGASGL
jgi:two-component system chemotaxis response regulator CheB